MFSNPKVAATIFAVLAIAALGVFLRLGRSVERDDQHPLQISRATLLLPDSFECPHEFQFLNTSWIGAKSGARPSVRVSTDGKSWGPWQIITKHPHSPAQSLRQFGQILSFDRNARFVQARDESGTGLSSLNLTFVNPSNVTAPTPQKLLATGNGNQVAKPPIVSRTDWGCPDGQGSRRTPSDSDVEFLIVHHTAGSNTSSNWAQTVQAIWSFHTITRGWGDVGYNFLIDPNGVIYEGRSGGEDSIGAHFSCANTNTMGISMIGDFTNIEPTTAALDSLKHLLAWKACKEGIDPQSTSFHNASQLDLQRISGHRDGNPSEAPGACPSGTVCPGAMLYPLLSGIRSDVATIIANGGVNIPKLELADRIYRDTSGGGNSDGQINPGEPIRLDVTLSNTGTGPATDLIATLSSTDPAVTITDNQKPFPNLAPGASDDETGDFNFTIAPGTPDGHIATLDLIVSNNLTEWAFTLSAPVVAPPNISINTANLSPDELAPGDSTTLSYALTSDQSVDGYLSVALRAGDGSLFQHPTFNFTTGITSGSQNKFRGLTLPNPLPYGTYDLILQISESAESPIIQEQTFPNALTVTAADLDYQSWVTIQQLPPEDSAANADPDADGYPNLLEYAFNLDPSNPSALQIHPHLVNIGAQSFPAITYTARNSQYLALTAELSNTSPANSTWLSGQTATTIFGSPINHPNGTRTSTVRSHKTTAEEPEQFFRLRATPTNLE